jgi:GntR family transcriptional repressor for pyruvate dehydrogenase complex
LAPKRRYQVTGERLFEQVELEARLSDRVADRLAESILTRELRPGDRLPSERELGEQFGVSRTVIREAVRSLAGRGIIEARVGRGLSVAAVPAETVRESMNFFLRARPSWDYRKVHEVRLLVETEVAGMAAERATDGELERMRQACEAMAAVVDEPDKATESDLEFHRALAAATHNDLVSIMLDAIADSLIWIRRETFGPTGRTRRALASHREILDRIVARDPSGARKAMAWHLDDVELAWERIEGTLAPEAGDPGGQAAAIPAAAKPAQA